MSRPSGLKIPSRIPLVASCSKMMLRSDRIRPAVAGIEHEHVRAAFAHAPHEPPVGLENPLQDPLGGILLENDVALRSDPARRGRNRTRTRSSGLRARAP